MITLVPNIRVYSFRAKTWPHPTRHNRLRTAIRHRADKVLPQVTRARAFFYFYFWSLHFVFNSTKKYRRNMPPERYTATTALWSKTRVQSLSIGSTKES
jgi:hypothetical protein